MKNKKIYILFSILITLFCFAIVQKTFQNDTYSAIRIGDYILHNGIDFVEHFNFNNLNYHNARWLFNVLIAFVYNNFEFLGVYIFTIISSIILGLTIFNTLLKRNKNLFISFFVTLIAIGASYSSLTARAQIISYILLFLEVIFIEKLIDSNKKIYILILLIISVLIANIHTTIWPMVLILFLPYFAEYIISKKFKKLKILYSKTENIKILFVTFIIIGLSGLLTPLGLLPYTYMFKTMSGISATYITELQKVNIFFDSKMFILTIIYLYLFVYLKKKIKISDLFLISGLYAMSVMANRNIIFLVIIGSISLSRLIMDSLEEYKDKFEIITNKLYKDKLIMGILMSPVIILIIVFIYINIYNKPYVDETIYPINAADYIVENVDLENIRLYNDFNDGAYLEFRGIKVFLDSRSEVYCKEFNNTSILEDYASINNMSKDYKPIFEKYNFNYVLLYLTGPLNSYISEDKDYEIVYYDDNFVLYKKVE